MKKLLGFLLLFAIVGAAGAWIWSGRQPPPSITIASPGAAMGASGVIDLSIEAPRGQLTLLDVVFEQGAKQTTLFTLAQQGGATLTQAGPDTLHLTLPATRKQLPDLKSGEARVIVHANRTVLRGLRTLPADVDKTFRVQLEPPQVSVVSTHHYINLGGSEFAVLRVTPQDATAGVRVGDKTYPSFPGSAVGIADPTLRVAMFALLYDQDLTTPIGVFASDAAGNTTTAPLDYKAFPKVFKRSRIDVPDAFLQRVVPQILGNSPDFAPEVSNPNDLVASFLAINGAMRRKNAQQIAGYAKQTAPQMLWVGPFQQLGNSQVEAAFADHRTYFYNGKEIDQQVHLGFDLAVTSSVEVVAANNGKVVHAAFLGIYGNCVIIDHGLGVQSLYAHLSSIGVKVGDAVTKGQAIGRSGMTGLAGGDHLHFTMLVNGQAVSAVEWWDTKWMEDRVLRKVREAGGNVAGTASAK
jgi:murein DD-endopeptidase MepM/ murein hydrolase activator NlpD